MSLTEDFPLWVKDAICYQIFPDRFAKASYKNGFISCPDLEKWGGAPKRNNFFGGNLQGVLARLDYIQELGCNTIYFCPIFTSTANHRYHTHDYFSIDPLLGTMADFDELVLEIHRRGMKIVLDAVLNHCSRGFYQFNSLLEVGENSPFKDWFHVKKWPLKAYQGGTPNYECWWGIKELPKFNTNNSDVRNFLFSVAEFWAHKGIDGWRLDVPNEIDDDSFWQEFRKKVKTINPELWIVGEIWDDPSRWLQGDQFDGVMNYQVRQAIVDCFFPGEDERNTGRKLSPKDLVEELNHYLTVPQASWMMSLPGSHDTRRIATLAGSRKKALKLLWAIYMFIPGAPCIYYGDELAMKGGKDPDNRRCFDWDQNNWDVDFRNFIKEIVSKRNSSDVLKYGDFKAWVEDENQGVIFLERSYNNSRVKMIINLSKKVYEIDLPIETRILIQNNTKTLKGKNNDCQKIEFNFNSWVVVESYL